MSISFFNLNIDVNNFKNITDIKVFNQSIKSNDIIEKKKKKFFYYKKKKFRRYCKILKKRCWLKKGCFFLVMVRLRYSPTDDDLSLEVHRLLRRIWNINTHSDKREHVECVIYEEWATEFF